MANSHPPITLVLKNYMTKILMIIINLDTKLQKIWEMLSKEIKLNELCVN